MHTVRIVLSTLALLFSLFSASSQDVSIQTKEKKRIEQEIADIDKQLSSTTSRQKQSLNTLALTQKKIENRKKLIAEIDSEVKAYDKEITVQSEEIAKLQSRLDTLQAYYNRLVYNSYKNRDSKIWFMYIMASDNIGQGLRRWSYLKNLSRTVKKQASEIRSAQIDLSLEQEKLRKLKTASIKTQKEREKEYNQLTREETQAKQTISDLKKQERKYRSELKKKKKEVEKLNQEIEKILAETIKKQKKPGSKESIDYALSAQFGDNKGKLPWPVSQGVIVEKFGQSNHPVFKNVKLPFNNGINVSTATNSDALCVFNGVVKQILVMPGYNQCVLVQHGEYFTFYCKLKKINVKSGQKLATGEKIGVVDDSDEGNAILHFQLWKGTTKQNPEAWLK